MMAKEINRNKFFLAVRHDAVLFGGSMPQVAVDNMNIVLDEWRRRALTLLTWLAYIFSTMRGEVGRNMAPVREGFSKDDASARAFVKRMGYRYAIVIAGFVWYGRGYVQLTWYENYIKFRDEVLARFGVDIVANPDAVLRPDIACYIMFEGMIRGVYTGKKLAHYFTETLTNWNARPIINGTDKMAFFGDMGRRFHRALVAAQDDAPEAPKEIVVASSEKETKNTVKTAAPTGAAGAGDAVTNTSGIDWLGWSLIGLAIVIVIVGFVLVIRKRRWFAEEWRKL